MIEIAGEKDKIHLDIEKDIINGGMTYELD